MEKSPGNDKGHPSAFIDNIFGPSPRMNLGHEFPHLIREGGSPRV